MSSARWGRNGMWSLANLPSVSASFISGCICIKLLHVLAVTMNFGSTDCVPCFCTESRCTYGYCESAWCLVGIKHNGRVIRTCGSQSSQQLQPCRQDVGDWQDVCRCTTPYCNTFAYLRYEIRWFGNVPGAGLDADPSPNRVASHQESAQVISSDSVVVFERTDQKDPGTVRQSYLVVVLVVVPLAVAGTAVIIVIAGYYCQMC